MTQERIPEGFGQPGDTYEDGTPPTTIFGPPDPTSFEHSDIAINTILFSDDGHPQGRLVSIVVHNFADLRATRDYRASALTNQSLLDNLQHGINATVQDFFFHQAEARKKHLGVQEKTKPGTPLATPTMAAPMTPVPSASQKDTAPTMAAPTTPVSSARKKDTTPASKKDARPKKDAEKTAATDTQFHLF